MDVQLLFCSKTVDSRQPRTHECVVKSAILEVHQQLLFALLFATGNTIQVLSVTTNQYDRRMVNNRLKNYCSCALCLPSVHENILGCW